MTTRAPDDRGDRPRRTVATQLELPGRTIVRVLLLLAALWLALRLWQLGLQLVLAVMLAALGVVGVLLALPAAAVPVIEKIWVPERRRRRADAEQAAALGEPPTGWPG